MTGSFNFSDAGGNVSSLTATAYDSSGHELGTASGQISGTSGVKAGTCDFDFGADTTQVGTFSIQIFVTDAHGSQSNILTATFQVLEPAWAIKTSLPTATGGLGVGVINGDVFAVGGARSSGGANALEEYDPVADSWTAKSSMPTARMSLAVGVVNGMLYAVGGGGGTATGTVEAYDPTSDTWTTKTSMPTPRTELAVGVINGILYAVGGCDANDNPLGTVEAYDPTSDTWTTKTSMPTPRMGLAVGVVNGMLYAVGGTPSVSFSSTDYSVVEEYNPTTDTWITKSPMPTPRELLAVAVVNNNLYAIGGYQYGLTGLCTVEEYNPSADSWSTKQTMPTCRGGLGAGVVNNTIYAIGGSNTYVNLTPAVEAYDPSLDP